MDWEEAWSKPQHRKVASIVPYQGDDEMPPGAVTVLWEPETSDLSKAYASGAFRELWEAGDEVWFERSSPKSWAHLAGRAGYALRKKSGKRIYRQFAIS